MAVYAKGYDYAFQHPTFQAMWDAGARFLIRYMYPFSQVGGTKNLTKAEADAGIAFGFKFVSNYEAWASRCLDGYAAGVADAKAAEAQHLACGGQAGRPIYFSVDFDTSPDTYDEVDAYFHGVISVLGLARTGAYGEYEIIKYLFDKGLIMWGWQTYAWSAGAYDERCQLAQDQNGISIGGGDADLDTAHAADYGQWPLTKTELGVFMALTDAQQTEMYRVLHDLGANGVAAGQASVGGTVRATLGTVQGIVNRLMAVQGALGLLSDDEAKVVAAIAKLPAVQDVKDAIAAAVPALTDAVVAAVIANLPDGIDPAVVKQAMNDTIVAELAAMKLDVQLTGSAARAVPEVPVAA